MDWINAAAGFFVGGVVGLTGVGGGSLMTPILVLLFGVAPSAAVGTDLWFAAITKAVGGTVHQGRGGVDWQVLRRLWLGSMPAAALTLWWLHASGAARQQHGLITVTLGVVLVLTALSMLLRKRIHAFGASLSGEHHASFRRAQPALTVAAGATLGVLVSLTSVGAGALGTAMLLYLYPRRMQPALLVGTDIVHAVPLTVVAGIGHLLMGNVDVQLLGNLLIGSIPGILLGSMLGGRLPDRWLRSTIAAVLAAVGVKLILA